MSLTRRFARLEDIDAITEVAIAGFSYDPQWNYRYPYRKKFPYAHRKFVRLAYVEYWERTQKGANQMLVVECPDDNNPNLLKVIAFSIWDNPGSKTAVPPVKNYFDRQDGNARRMRAFFDVTMRARQELFVTTYGPHQMSLRMLVTHPEYWRRSAGRIMMEWGIEEAAKRNLAIVMFSSAMGMNLYVQFGFQELAKVRVEVPGEKESVDVSCLAWEPGWNEQNRY